MTDGIVSANVTLTGLTPLIVNRKHKAFIEKEVDTKSLEVDEEMALRLYYLEDGAPYWPAINVLAALYEGAVGQKLGKVGLRRYIPTISITTDKIPIYDPSNGVNTPAEWVVDERPVVIDRSSIMRRRPRFDSWALKFPIHIMLNPLRMKENEALNWATGLFEDVGLRIGFGDFRPAKSGVYGKFAVEIFKD